MPRQLNEEGQEKLLNYVLNLPQSAAERYKATLENPQLAQLEGKKTILMYGPILAADMSWWFADENSITIRGFRKALAEIDGDVTLRINSPGGDVQAANGIRQAILERVAGGDKVECVIEGNCASAAALFAIACSHVTMTELSTFMVHRISGLIRGNSEQLKKIVDYFESMDKIQAKIYVEKTGKSKKEIDTYMRDEKYFTSEEALEAGWCDEVVAVAQSEPADDPDAKAILDGHDQSLRDIFNESAAVAMGGAPRIS